MSADRHTWLLVEDQVDLANEIRGLLEAHGYGCVHAATLDEAIPIIERGGFCGCIFDLQIKAKAQSISALVDSGYTLIRQTRQLYPRRNHRGVHLLPIVAMSAFLKDHHHIRKAYQCGIDDSVAKPLSDNYPSFEDTLRNVLRSSGHSKHQRCARLIEQARVAAHPIGPGVAATTPALALVVTARMEDKRTVVEIGDRDVPLTPGSLVLVLKLVLARMRTAEGWVLKTDLAGAAGSGNKGMSRLKLEVQPFLRRKGGLFENDADGGYRLRRDVAVERVDHESLRHHADARVRRLAAEIQKAAPDSPPSGGAASSRS